MEDVAEFLKRNLQTLHKKKGDKFGNMLSVDALKERTEKMKFDRKNHRHDLISEMRRMPAVITPQGTPARPNNDVTVQVEAPPKVQARLEMLRKWKEDKAKKIAEMKRSAKPLFKVTHVPTSVGLPNLENVNTVIKGKQFKSKFAPVNHKFKAPANVEAIHIAGEEPAESASRTTRMVTRSQAKGEQKSAPSSVVGMNKKQSTKKKGMPKRNATPLQNNDGAGRSRQTTSKTKPSTSRQNASRTKSNTSRQNASRTEPGTSRGSNTSLAAPNTSGQKASRTESGTSRGSNTSRTRSNTSRQNASRTEPEAPRDSNTSRTDTVASQQNISQAKADTSRSNISRTESANDGDLNHSTLMSPDFAVSAANVSTPAKQIPPVYVSPFVTVSRGKSSARKEYEARRSRINNEELPKVDVAQSSPAAGAAYFSWVLNSQISRLTEMSESWERYKNDENPPEEAISMIDVAIGQTNLLISKKFEQFRGLIEKCEMNDRDTPVTCEDLHGFWDMVFIQVKNLDARFENLNTCKLNNWEEVVPKTKSVVVKKKKSVRNAKASAGLKAAIEAARKRRMEVNEEAGINGRLVQKTPTETRKSVLTRTSQVGSGRTESSPGLMMMKVSQYAKTVETPGKSILKTDVVKSVTKNKIVLFEDEVSDLENDSNILNSIRSSSKKSKTPTRRSTRLRKSVVKLF